jgi:AraC-like DNA-binding protein
VSGSAPYRTRALHPALTPYVTSLVVYDVAMGPPGVHRGVPSTSLTLVLPVDSPLDVGWSDDPASRAHRWSVVSGLHAAPASIHHDGYQRGVQLGLTPAGSRALLGLPPAALCRQLVRLDELGPAGPQVRVLGHLPEQLHDSPDSLERLRLAHDALLLALAGQGRDGPRPEVTRALALLGRGRPVGAVAQEVGWSRRHLAVQVRSELGLSPKTYQRVARFQTARSRLLLTARRGRQGLADLAAACGYADQAHLTREWVAMAGCTPSRWLAEEFPFLQDSPAAREQTDRDGTEDRRRNPAGGQDR